ncbi:nitrilase-related carbon-nitrogen hydrolase [Aureibacter tunicatorum]|uniref:Amidohydrolase n=1 Tax=Aureibacter tunicatorum TaxID=866807 RepID=A0AAE3XJQ5_9BACT|nr:nitrilase-related carbon-nitrogen hydrolase [Aureibacter tunicatorum]MDR6239016.1 putative amidohydrolase [Aureibacter tunicatorum]BDD05058.1 nitrilase family protein [Aureibacter tunicatorum]
MEFKNDLRVALTQPDLVWEDVDANLANLEEELDEALYEDDVDLIVLPETFNTGFTSNTQFAEPMNGKTHRWMKLMAQRYQCTVLGTILIKEKGDFYNRALVVDEDGKTSFYDKRHLFRMGDENTHLAPGGKILTFILKGWKISPFICYDLRFPVWCRNNRVGESLTVDLFVFMASWPKSRRHVWDVLLTARAIENQSFVIGVNRVGSDDNMEYDGGTKLLDYKGFESDLVTDNQSGVIIVNLNKSRQEEFREKFPAYLDSDNFIIKK